MKIGILSAANDVLELIAVLPAEHELRRLTLGYDGFETSTAYACSFVVISAAAIPVARAKIISKRMREVAITVAITHLPPDIRPEDLLPHADFVVQGNLPETWRNVVCAAKWDAQPRVVRDADFSADSAATQSS